MCGGGAAEQNWSSCPSAAAARHLPSLLVAVRHRCLPPWPLLLGTVKSTTSPTRCVFYLSPPFRSARWREGFAFPVGRGSRCRRRASPPSLVRDRSPKPAKPLLPRSPVIPAHPSYMLWSVEVVLPLFRHTGTESGEFVDSRRESCV